MTAGNVKSARGLMDTLKKQGEAKAQHFNIMLGACQSSAEIRDAIYHEMPEAGVDPDVVSFTVLVHQLMVEGSTAEAHRVVNEEMPAAGVKPNNRTSAALGPAKLL